jgi:hypothetical protein
MTRRAVLANRRSAMESGSRKRPSLPKTPTARRPYYNSPADAKLSTSPGPEFVNTAQSTSFFRSMNNPEVKCVQDNAMSEFTFPIEFIGGSRDGEIIETTTAPDYYEVPVAGRLKEIYERQSDELPFVYVQIGYAENETWK